MKRSIHVFFENRIEEVLSIMRRRVSRDEMIRSVVEAAKPLDAKTVLMHIHFRFIVNERSSPPRCGVINAV